jgi:hypothetical protein
MTTERIQDENIDLIDQVRWWTSGGGWLHKDGHFNFNHYCNVIKQKNERIRYNTLDTGNTEIQTQTNHNDSSGIRY